MFLGLSNCRDQFDKCPSIKEENEENKGNCFYCVRFCEFNQRGWIQVKLPAIVKHWIRMCTVCTTSCRVQLRNPDFPPSLVTLWVLRLPIYAIAVKSALNYLCESFWENQQVGGMFQLLQLISYCRNIIKMSIQFIIFLWKFHELTTSKIYDFWEKSCIH